jgi:hypothetical protein
MSQRVVWTIQTSDDDLVPSARRLVDNDRLPRVLARALPRRAAALLPWKRINASLADGRGRSSLARRVSRSASKSKWAARGGTV